MPKLSRLKRAQWIDSCASLFIKTGGIAVICSVVLIILLIAKEAIPLFFQPSADGTRRFESVEVKENGAFAVGIDDNEKYMFAIHTNATISVYSFENESLIETLTIKAPEGASAIRHFDAQGNYHYSVLWDNGSLSLIEMKFSVRFDDEGTKSYLYALNELAALSKPVADGEFKLGLARDLGENSSLGLFVDTDNQVYLVKKSIEVDFMDNETEVLEESTLSSQSKEDITHIAINDAGSTLHIATEDGFISGWNIQNAESPKAVTYTQVVNGGKTLTSLIFVYGGESLAIGDSAGNLSTWSLIPNPAGSGYLFGNLHTLRPHQKEIFKILPSRRDKSIMSLSQGHLHLDHMTSERALYDFQNDSSWVQAALSIQAKTLIALDENNQISVWELKNPHPEISWSTLFGKVHYESYAKPEFVWQSSSASDDFEPKMSLVPLVFGSLKGTLYAMIFAVPIGILGALYTSQLTSPAYRSVIKPAVEIMAAIPSVIIGFLAALWLAPIINDSLSSFFLSLAILPVTLLISILIWQFIREWQPLKGVEKGLEFIIAIPILFLALYLAAQIGPALEEVFFGGNVKQWMFTEAGIRYDPRNCIVIGFALGFAVIPIIFTISEDAFSNVPRSMTAASLAVGASRWQTVWRVILPSASPGVFAGIIIGFGRAIGETMIVLMATGNTPIMDWSVFNGMRTLSANIAVEIPEAPHGGTLYRVLFLSAIVLFILTSTLNTAAEVIRQRLRKKYGQFQ